MFSRKKAYKFFVLLSIMIFTTFFISSCKKSNDNFDQVNPINMNSNQLSETAAPTDEVQSDNTIPDIDEENINPLDEEKPGIPIDFDNEQDSDYPINLGDDNNSDNEKNDDAFTNYDKAPSMDSYTGEIKYAGSTPIAILPVDMPTPTPRQPLKFNYTDYNASSLNLKFQAPSGWEVDESQHDTYILKEPEANKKDDFSAIITITAVPLSKEYTQSDLNREIRQQLDQLGSRNYSRWSPSAIAKRSLLNHDGVYANFRGTLVTGQIIRGRIHMTVINQVLYSLQIIHPAEYNNDFIGVFTNIRRTMNFINKD